MIASHGQRTGQKESQGGKSSRKIGGVALMLLGTALVAYGTHFLAKTGNCSGTGYVSYGPVPKCGGGEALYIMSTFFLGPVAIVAGWLLAQVSGLLWPMFCAGMAVGLITIDMDTSVAPGARAFALITGEGLVALVLLSVAVTVRKRLRRAHQ